MFLRYDIFSKEMSGFSPTAVTQKAQQRFQHQSLYCASFFPHFSNSLNKVGYNTRSSWRCSADRTPVTGLQLETLVHTHQLVRLLEGESTVHVKLELYLWGSISTSTPRGRTGRDPGNLIPARSSIV